MAKKRKAEQSENEDKDVDGAKGKHGTKRAAEKAETTEKAEKPKKAKKVKDEKKAKKAKGEKRPKKDSARSDSQPWHVDRSESSDTLQDTLGQFESAAAAVLILEKTTPVERNMAHKWCEDNHPSWLHDSSSDAAGARILSITKKDDEPKTSAPRATIASASGDIDPGSAAVDMDELKAELKRAKKAFKAKPEVSSLKSAFRAAKAAYARAL
eukprot:SAG31_NODE_5166_length_2704_cov_2.110940_1_plen_212_part_00